MINSPIIIGGTKLPELTNPGTAADLLAGKQLIDAEGNVLTGTAMAIYQNSFAKQSATTSSAASITFDFSSAGYTLPPNPKILVLCFGADVSVEDLSTNTILTDVAFWGGTYYVHRQGTYFGSFDSVRYYDSGSMFSITQSGGVTTLDTTYWKFATGTQYSLLTSLY